MGTIRFCVLACVLLASCSTSLRTQKLNPVPSFSPPLHTASIPQVSVTCTSTGAQQHEVWTNNLGQVAVVGGDVWLGVDMGAVEDAYVLIINLMSGDVWAVTNEDHYRDRGGGAHSADIPFGLPPYWWMLNANDQIETLVGCRGLPGFHVGASVTVQYLSPILQGAAQ